MTDIIPYPWQQQHWQSLLGQIERDKLPHGVLLSGQKGIGKWHYAELIANYLLCASPVSGLPCTKCRSCELLATGNHPDKLLVQPEEVNKAIKVDQIRHLSAFVAKTAQQQGYKIAVIGPVEQLNTNAGNALLKSLEEPAGRTVLILTTNVTSGVMATIRSRCQLYPMPVPSHEASLEWLNSIKVSEDSEALLSISAGSPLQASEVSEGAKREALQLFLSGLAAITQQEGSINLNLSKQWLALELADIVDWWSQLINLIIHKAHKLGDSTNMGKEGEITELLNEILSQSQYLRLQWLYKLLDRILTIKRQLLAGANPNKQLLLEELLLDWGTVVKAAVAAQHHHKVTN